MNITELFNELDENLELNGELTLHEKDQSIVWEYKATDIINEHFDTFDYDDEYGCNELFNLEDELYEIYDNDIIKIENHLDLLGVLDKFTLNDPSVFENVISFSLY